MKICVENFVRPDIKNLKPYIVDDVAHEIKMDANENPYSMPEHIRNIIAEEVLRHHFNRYPDPVAMDLRKSLASELDVDINQLAIGNGSDELINYIISAFGGKGAVVIFPIPTFSIYRIFAELWATKALGIPLSDEFDIQTDDVIKESRNFDRSIIFISYPNNPTGNCFSSNGIMRILEESGSSIVVLDEAYYEFSRKTFLPLLKDYENLVILRTFSKAYGLAGLRVGYMIANEKIISQIMKVKMVYNINSLSQKIAFILLKYKEEMSLYIDRILEERQRLIKQLGKTTGIGLFPTDANFILFRVEPDADMLFSRLLEKGVLIRNLNSPGLLKSCLRVTVGTPEENDLFLSAL